MHARERALCARIRVRGLTVLLELMVLGHRAACQESLRAKRGDRRWATPVCGRCRVVTPLRGEAGTLFGESCHPLARIRTHYARASAPTRRHKTNHNYKYLYLDSTHTPTGFSSLRSERKRGFRCSSKNSEQQSPSVCSEAQRSPPFTACAGVSLEFPLDYFARCARVMPLIDKVGARSTELKRRGRACWAGNRKN